MGGIGKSTLAAKVAQLLQEQFQFVIWRSLRNAPLLETLLSELVPFLSNQQDLLAIPERLLYWLQSPRPKNCCCLNSEFVRREYQLFFARKYISI